MRTFAAIVKELGGSRSIADRFGFRHQSRVSNWPHIGIPRAQWPDILDLAKERGIGLTLEDLRAAEALLPASKPVEAA